MLHRCWDKISKKELPEVPQLRHRIFSRNSDLFARNFSGRERDGLSISTFILGECVGW
jgi:hypothetical protein